jgi:molybdopterin-guanine dinucleotide biosynthesis protein A
VTYGALVIAAGFSRRFGSDKRIFKLNTGEPC